MSDGSAISSVTFRFVEDDFKAFFAYLNHDRFGARFWLSATLVPLIGLAAGIIAFLERQVVGGVVCVVGAVALAAFPRVRIARQARQHFLASEVGDVTIGLAPDGIQVGRALRPPVTVIGWGDVQEVVEERGLVLFVTRSTRRGIKAHFLPVRAFPSRADVEAFIAAAHKAMTAAASSRARKGSGSVSDGLPAP